MAGRITVALLSIFILTGYSNKTEIQDLRDISQNHRTFTERQAEQFNRLDRALQKKADAFHNTMFFSPWHRDKSHFTLEEVQWEFDKYGKDTGYGKNGKKHSHAWIKKLIANARLEVFPRGEFPAITVRNTDLRVLPTSDVHVTNPKNSRWPFDNLQNSGAAANTPIFVSHITRDKKWVLAETSYAMGWMPANHMSPVDAEFMKRWETGNYAVIVKDKTSIYDDRGVFLFKAPLGLFFPKAGESDKTLHILAATMGDQGKAVIKNITLGRETAATKPLPLTAENMAILANELMNKPYGWGGLGQRRDCSSTLMDLFAPFGIWLPRNSGHQAKQAGAFIDLKDFPPEEKEKMIITQGLPYFTLLWLKGHIMLYIGNQGGHALVFHNFWSVKTRNAQGATGKKIIGKAAITTLRPGQELRQGNGPGDILPAILGMTILWPPPSSPDTVPFRQEDQHRLED